ncbi:MAG: hypothetical protein PUJ82_11705 [Spirochaetales bacterium]|nr:hypothetical protein [Spirochaetales bacterium]
MLRKTGVFRASAIASFFRFASLHFRTPSVALHTPCRDLNK